MTKKVVAWLTAILACAAFGAWAGEGVPSVRNLHKEAASARAMHGAILLVLVAKGCVYCQHVLDDFLIPMSRNPNYRSRLVMRRLEISDSARITDFNGRPVPAKTIVGRYGRQIVPTVVLLDSQGRLLGEPLVGLTTPDYYGLYLDQAIDAAVAKVRGQTSAPGN